MLLAMGAVLDARERQEAMLPYEQKCQDAAEAETIYSSAMKDTPEKTERVERARPDSDHEGGVLGDYVGRLLPNTL